MVARPNEDGEEACTCVNVEKSRSGGNSKKSNSNRSTSDDEAIYSAACHTQSNDEVGKLNGRPVKVLGDTGCTGMIVDRALIPDSMVIPGNSASLQMVHHTLIDVPLATVYLDSPYYKEHCKVICVCSSIYPVIIGNMRGARQMLPDSDWKVDNHREARASRGPVGATMMTMTTKVVICLDGCSKRSPTDQKPRTETQRRSQPRSRKIIAVLLKILKSKRIPQKESVLLDQC